MSPGGAAPAALEEVSSTEFPDHNSTDTADPWDDDVTVPTGSNRVLLDLMGVSNPGVHTGRLDPAGDNIALTPLTGSPAGAGATDENALGFVLVEASFPGTNGTKNLRCDWASSHRGGRRVIFLRNAAQTVESAGNSITGGALTVSLTRSSGTFPTGSRVYACMYAQSTGTYTITGNVTEVVDVDITTDNDSWAFAAGTLGSATATVTATFTRDAGGSIRKGGIIAVVETL